MDQCPYTGSLRAAEELDVLLNAVRPPPAPVPAHGRHHDLVAGVSAALHSRWQEWTSAVVSALLSWALPSTNSGVGSSSVIGGDVQLAGTPVTLHTRLKELASEVKRTMRILRVVRQLAVHPASPLNFASGSSAAHDDFAHPPVQLHHAGVTVSQAASMLRLHLPASVLRYASLDADDHVLHHCAPAGVNVLSFTAFLEHRLGDAVAAAVVTAHAGGGEGGAPASVPTAATAAAAAAEASFVLDSVADHLQVHLVAACPLVGAEVSERGATVFFSDGEGSCRMCQRVRALLILIFIISTVCSDVSVDGGQACHL